ncbi:MAG TPA: hypothetical protein VIL53_05545 [Solirubrobacterales bacterium]
MVQSRWGVRAVSAAALIGAFAFVPGLARAAITTNPANRPVLLSQPIEDLHYDYAKRCLSHPQPGTLALQSWLEDNWRGVSWGIMRCEKLSPHNYSLHSEGRAIDWHLDAGVPAEYHAAMRLIDMLLATDEDGNEAALARRMGVQGLIFNCRQWFGYGDQLGPYSYCHRRDGKLRKYLDRTLAHRNHIHIELNWAGARKRTSFWRSPLAP